MDVFINRIVTHIIGIISQFDLTNLSEGSGLVDVTSPGAVAGDEYPVSVREITDALR
jgi:hypothetical protein